MLDAAPMRIIAGTLKGRTIRTPEGSNTRPTSDRARESLFNVLAHADWAPGLEGARVIDAFAGSGALGFEAISRGAAFCLFVETEAAARGCIRDNVEAFQLFGNTRIHRRSATDLGPKPAGLGALFDLVFMDPPYRIISDELPALGRLLAALATRGGYLVLESASAAPATAYDDVLRSASDRSFALVKQRAYGDTMITLWERVDAEEDAQDGS